MTMYIPDDLGYAELHTDRAANDDEDHVRLAIAHALVDIAKSLRTIAGRDDD